MISIKHALTLAILLLFAHCPVFGHYEDPDQRQKSIEEFKKASKEKKPEKVESKETSTAIDPWKLLEMALSPAYAYVTKVSITIQGDFRVIKSNGLPDHKTGAFPNSGNPNTISEQSYSYKVAKDPTFSGKTTRLGMYPFGVAINGIPFDPNAAEWWQRNPRSGWTYEAMALGSKLGLDQNNAHVQPNGAYHYHGIPTGLMERFKNSDKPLLIGYAADGFPIYGPYGYEDPKNSGSRLVKLKASYRVKSGTRPGGPGGTYNGIFVEDYEFVEGSGDLDDTNGRFGFTQEYPDGIYYYVVTDHFPYIPRGFKGTPNSSFFRHGPGRGRRRGMGRPGFGRMGQPGRWPPPGGRRPPPGGFYPPPRQNF